MCYHVWVVSRCVFPPTLLILCMHPCYHILIDCHLGPLPHQIKSHSSRNYNFYLSQHSSMSLVHVCLTVSCIRVAKMPSLMRWHRSRERGSKLISSDLLHEVCHLLALAYHQRTHTWAFGVCEHTLWSLNIQFFEIGICIAKCYGWAWDTLYSECGRVPLFPPPFFVAVRFEWSKVWGERVGERNRLVANAIEYRPIFAGRGEEKNCYIFGVNCIPFIRELLVLCICIGSKC